MLTDDDWKRLRTRTGASEPLDLRTLFAADDARAERLTFTAGDLTVDLSKHLIDDNVLDALLSFGETALLERHRDAMFAGDRINQTEMRSVLHTALRLPHDASLVVDGIDVVPEIHAVLDHMTTFAQLVRTGSWTGATGQRIETVINIGIGGSDLGPAMAARALAHHSPS